MKNYAKTTPLFQLGIRQFVVSSSTSDKKQHLRLVDSSYTQTTSAKFTQACPVNVMFAPAQASFNLAF
ncbi:hypothetical protein Plhal304r1_c004g0014691 [Plasmopara halstedii]